MQNIYFVSDTHLYHTNIIKYCDRPFNSVEEMNKTIIKNWNDKIKADDIVYHLGDLTLHNNEVKELVYKLNGKIYLIRGNHDHKSISYYNRCGITVMPTQTKLDKYKIILSHRPLEDNQIPEGYINVHGHIHNHKLDERFDKKRHLNISVEQTDYKPLSKEELLERIDKLK